MANRRQVLQFGAGITTLPFLPLGRVMAAGMLPRQAIDRVLSDTRFPGSALQASQLATQFAGSPQWYTLDGNIGRYWREESADAGKARPAALAGVTGEDVLFCLEQRARDQRQRVQWRQTVSPATGTSPALVAWYIA